MNHRDAVESLANSMDPTTWVTFKEPVLSHRHDGIPDVLCIKKSYSNFEIRVYEVKVSDSDLMSDIRSSKFEKYFNMAHRVYFALGPEVSSKYDEILKHEKIGITRFKTVWRTKKHAPRISTDNNCLSSFDYLALLMNGDSQEGRKRISRLDVQKQLLLKSDIKQLSYSKIKELNKAASLLVDENRKAQQLKEFTMQDAKHAIMREVGVYYAKEDLLNQLIEKSLRNATQNFKDTFETEMTTFYKKLSDLNQT